MSGVFIAILAFSVSPWLAGLGVLVFSIWLFLSHLGLELSVAEIVLICGLVGVAPLSAWLAGGFLDRFCVRLPGSAVFSTLAVALSFPVMIESEFIGAALNGVLMMLAAGSLREQSMLLLALGNAAFFCGGLVAFVIAMLALVVELTFGLCFGRSRAAVISALGVLRPATVLLLLCLSLNHISGLFIAELSPLMLLKKAWGA